MFFVFLTKQMAGRLSNCFGEFTIFKVFIFYNRMKGIVLSDNNNQKNHILIEVNWCVMRSYYICNSSHSAI